MTSDDVTEWRWESAEAARAYLADVGRLWGAWAIALGLLFTTSGNGLILVSLAAFVVLVVLSRPVQRHADVVEAPDLTLSKLRGGSQRDHVARRLLYGADPIRAAVRDGDAAQFWVWARHAIVAGTFGAFIWVVVSG